MSPTQLESFKPLYAISSNGKTKYWQIEVIQISNNEPVIIETKHGYLNGNLASNISKVSKGKNIGKANETTPWEQACFQAKSKWEKKLNEGYTTSIDKPSAIKLPMLAHDYFKRGNAIKFPCYVQPKLDGIRMVAHKTTNGISLYSRNGKLFTTLTHLLPQLDLIMKVDEYLDGEIYTPELDLQEIVSLVKNNSEDKGRSLLQYWIYDTIIEDLPYCDRLTKLNQVKANFNLEIIPNLVIVDTYLAENSNKVNDFHFSFISQGSEGLILRNSLGLYNCNHRSTELQKYKKFKTDEFIIKDVVGGELGKAEEDAAIFVCETKAGVMFHVRPKGGREIRKQWLLDKNNLIGKYLTVKFFDYTPGESVPFHPVGESIRDYE